MEASSGELPDKIHVKHPVILATSFASVSAFVLWALFAAKSAATLLIFAFLSGCFGAAPGLMGKDGAHCSEA